MKSTRRKNDRQPDPPGILVRQSAAAKRERIAAIVAEIRAGLPPWALLPPWDAERFIEPQPGRDVEAAR